MLGLKLIHVSKRGPRSQWVTGLRPNIYMVNIYCDHLEDVIYHWQLNCFLNRLIRLTTRKTLKATRHWSFRTGIHRWFPAQRTSNADSVSISWRHHVDDIFHLYLFSGGKVILTCREINITGDRFLRENLDPTLQRLRDEQKLKWIKKERVPNFLHDHIGMLLVMEPM